MPDERAPLELSNATTSPLIFISHDSRDAELAEAFSTLLKSVSAGMLKSFRSSDKSGAEGIEFGDEWYKTLMTKLNAASDVVCLITERSVGRPWILYEAGVAKGKMDTPVHGLALGVPLSQAGVGPFYQFQNSDDSEESITKLVLQLCKRITGLEPDDQVVQTQIALFKQSEAEALKKMGDGKQIEKNKALDDGAAAKVLEEMKLVVRELPLQLEHRLSDLASRGPSRKIRRLHPEMIYDIASMGRHQGTDGLGLLILCGIFRDDFPWLYEIALETYRVFQTATQSERQEAADRMMEATDITFRSPMREILITSRESYSSFKEMPEMIDRLLRRMMESPPKKKSRVRAI